MVGWIFSESYKVFEILSRIYSVSDDFGVFVFRFGVFRYSFVCPFVCSFICLIFLLIC